MTDDEKIEAIIASLRGNALEDIKCALAGSSKMGAFILSSCLIEAIAGFIKGDDTDRNDYKDFVAKYMPVYNKDKLYEDLRCKLVHSYSEGGSFWFVDNKAHLHCAIQNGKTYINLENFIAEIDSALSIFEIDLKNKSNTAVRAKAIKRYDDNGVVQIMNRTVDSTVGVTAQFTSLSGVP